MYYHLKSAKGKLMQKYCVLVVLFFLSCQNRQGKSVTVTASANTNSARTSNGDRGVKPELKEFFADSVAIGKKSFDKIEFAKYRAADSSYATIRFYAKENNRWEIKNEFHFKADSILEFDPKLSDFNRDGFNDITYVSTRAARGANEVRKLFIYDSKNDKLIFLKNSEDYPNMLYNKELNCIDAFLISGCNTTIFLKIDRDSLKEFASIDQCDRLTVSTYDQKGNEKVILRKKTNKDQFSRFKNYKPLKEYDEK